MIERIDHVWAKLECLEDWQDWSIARRGCEVPDGFPCFAYRLPDKEALYIYVGDLSDMAVAAGYRLEGDGTLGTKPDPCLTTRKRLTPEQRERLVEIVQESNARLAEMTPEQRRELEQGAMRRINQGPETNTP